jgi:multidrug efflux pump subunit AcrA (membrane-fusion protein)
VSAHRVYSSTFRSFGVVLVAAAALSGCSGSAESGGAGATADALAVTVVEVRPVDVPREVEAVGTLNAQDETVVSAEVEARVAKLAADMGDRVAAGAPLVILDAEKLRYRLEEQRAALEQARARLGARGDALPPVEQAPEVLSTLAQRKEAEGRLTRARHLAERQLVSAEDLERAETQLETARAAHETALAEARNLHAEIAARTAALRGAERELHDTTIRAPFEGVIAERLVSPGQFVRLQTPVMRLVRMHPLRLTAEIPERFAPAIRVGHVLSVRVDAYPDRPVEGRITRLSPAVNPRSRAFAIEGEVPNADGSLKPGTFARVRIVTDRVDRTIVIPVSAVQTRYGRSVVFLVKDGKLSASEVTVGDRLGPRVEILDGVTAGSVIVAENVEGLTDGMAVTPRQQADAEQEGASR